MHTSKTEHFESYRQKHAFMAELPNVSLNFGPVEDENAHPLEQVYLSNIFKNLSQEPHFKNFNFYIIGSQAPWDFEINEKSVVFYMSNEDHVIPESVSKAHAVFTPYCPLNNCPSNVFAIPLGYNGSLRELPIKPIEERSIDVFFSGNLHRRRGPFFLGTKLFLFMAKMMGKPYNLRVGFGRQFGGGLSPDEYSKVLMDSKIALVPEGYISNNSFRFFEASKYGTIVITKTLYDFWFYKNFPGYQRSNWFGLGRLLNRLLSDEAKMKAVHQEMLSYFQSQCSENAVAHYIAEQLK